MKTFIISIISLLSFSVYSQNRYELQDEGKEKLYLSDTISKMAEKKIITSEPIVVIDGVPYRFQDLEKKTNCHYRKMKFLQLYQLTSKKASIFLAILEKPEF